jgi:7,8-dihydropterin-6-yl-methyl-4-(beta-D-ribofuranosyl)aminobenzene 5'-phosphate synthase
MPIDLENTSLPRRDVLCGGGAAVFGAMITALLGGTKPVRAQSISGAVPEVDSLAVRVVIDSYQFAVAPSTKAMWRFNASAGGLATSRPARR